MPSPKRRCDQLPPAEVCRRLLSQRAPLVCAHGGDSSRAPPNTAAAYRLALEAGADCMEVDVSRTADGGLVALHVVQLDAGQYHHSRLLGERVPTLEEALRTLGGKLKTIIVDVKTGPPLHEVSLAYDVLNVVRQAGCHNCLVWSKLDGVVAELKQLEPAIKAGYIFMTDSRTGQAGSLLRLVEPEVVGVFYGLVTPQLVAEVHSGAIWAALNDSVQRWEGGSGLDL
eukprot:SM000011S19183  [mRNA]  locus=s11:1252534:1254423:- [translate_table: standard]